MIPPDSQTESLLPTAIRSGVGVGDVFLRFDLLFGVGDGVGEAFFDFGEAVGVGVGVAFFVECLRCWTRRWIRLEDFLIFEPNDSSAEGRSIESAQRTIS